MRFWFGIACAAGIMAAGAALAQTPRSVYRVETTLAVITPGAEVSWLEPSEAPAEAARRFLGQAASAGITPEFLGARSVFFELGVDRFKPIPRGEAPIFGGDHEITLTFRLIDPESGRALISDTRKLDLWATGFADEIGPKRRIENWITVASRRWADGLDCNDMPCGAVAPVGDAPVAALAPTQVETAPTPQQVQPAPAPQQAQPAPTPQPVALEPQQTETVVLTPTPAPAPTPAPEPAPQPQPRLQETAATPAPRPTPQPREVANNDDFNLRLSTGSGSQQPIQRSAPAPRAIVDLSGAISED